MKPDREVSESFIAKYNCADDSRWMVEVPDSPGIQSQGNTLEQARENIRNTVRQSLQSRGAAVNRDPDRDNALWTLTQAWPPFVDECRAVLGSELHYQAMLYHCLRANGQVPIKHLGMNVKIWINDVVSEYFRKLDEKKAEGYRGGFEPIPDVVIFRPEIDGDFRRRNRDNTLRQMVMAIEVKASERYRRRITAGEVVDDIVKLDALRIEARHRGSELLPAVVIIDTAPEENERMRPGARREIEAAVREHEVCSLYVSPSDTSLVLTETL